MKKLNSKLVLPLSAMGLGTALTMVAAGQAGNHPCLFGYCGCAALHEEIATVQPNLLVVLDRSESMNEPLGMSTKWEVAKGALTELAAKYGQVARLGLALYPGSDLACSAGATCEAGPVLVDPGAASADAFGTVLSTASTCQLGTPTAEMFESLLSYQPLRDPDRESFVLLVTDGASTCTDPQPHVASLLSSSPPVKTFVIGFGAAVDATELDALADAGGTARPDTPRYYQAETAADLYAALESVMTRAFPCTYDFAPQRIFTFMSAYFGSERVPRDESHIEGWDHDGLRVTFYGEACRRLASGAVSEFTVIIDECRDAF